MGYVPQCRHKGVQTEVNTIHMERDLLFRRSIFSLIVLRKRCLAIIIEWEELYV